MSTFDENFQKALAVLRERKEGRRTEAKGPTVEEMSTEIEAALPELGKRMFKAGGAPLRGASQDDAVHITYAAVPRGSDELATLNAPKSSMLSINPAPGYPWSHKGSSPALLVAEQFRGRGMKFRKKTGTWPQIKAAIVKFFKEQA